MSTWRDNNTCWGRGGGWERKTGAFCLRGCCSTHTAAAFIPSAAATSLHKGIERWSPLLIVAVSNQSRLSPCVLMRVDELSAKERERENAARSWKKIILGEPNTKKRPIHPPSSIAFTFSFFFFFFFFLSKGINTAAAAESKERDRFHCRFSTKIAARTHLAVPRKGRKIEGGKKKKTQRAIDPLLECFHYTLQPYFLKKQTKKKTAPKGARWINSFDACRQRKHVDRIYSTLKT